MSRKRVLQRSVGQIHQRASPCDRDACGGAQEKNGQSTALARASFIVHGQRTVLSRVTTYAAPDGCTGPLRLNDICRLDAGRARHVQ